MLEASSRLVCSIVHTAFHDRASLPDQLALRGADNWRSAKRISRRSATRPPALREARTGSRRSRVDAQTFFQKGGRDQSEPLRERPQNGHGADRRTRSRKPPSSTPRQEGRNESGNYGATITSVYATGPCWTVTSDT